jgi:hypothetical protein
LEEIRLLRPPLTDDLCPTLRHRQGLVTKASAPSASVASSLVPG